MAPTSDSFRQSTLSYAQSRLSRIPFRFSNNNLDNSRAASRERPESIACSPAQGQRRSMSAAKMDRSCSMDTPRIIPDFSFDNIDFDPVNIPQKSHNHTATALAAMANDVDAPRPKLTSKSTTHIASQLNTGRLSSDGTSSLLSPIMTTDSGTPSSRSSTNFEKLVQDTEFAFEAVSSALAEMRLSRASSPLPPPTPPPKDPARFAPKVPNRSKARPPVGRRKSSSRSSTKKKSPKPAQRQKSQASQKSSASSSQPAPIRKASSKTPGRRWALPTNVIKMFQKIEADEVVTPGQIEAFKQRKMSLAQAEQDEQEKTETQNPGSLESLLDEGNYVIRTASDLAGTPPLGYRSPSVYSADDHKDSESGELSESSRRQALSFGSPSSADWGMTFFHDTTPYEGVSPASSYASLPPPLPVRHPRRSMMPTNASPLMPLALAANNAAASTSALKSSKGKDGQEFVYLRSTPCSMAAPTFKHGPIRFSKTVVVSDSPRDYDDGLDWTAFQMAFRGNSAGDWYAENEETTRRRESEEATDLLEWWSSWNFEGAGALLSAVHPDLTDVASSAAESSVRNSMATGHSTDSSASLSDGLSDENEDDDEEEALAESVVAAYSLSPANPYSAHYKWNNTVVTRSNTTESQVQPGNKTNATADVAIEDFGKNVLAENDDPEVVPSTDPQVVCDPASELVDFVPMGCNLSSDLDDYLQWEAQHAYAGNY